MKNKKVVKRIIENDGIIEPCSEEFYPYHIDSCCKENMRYWHNGLHSHLRKYVGRKARLILEVYDEK